MKFSFIVAAMILNFASSNNPNSININLETAFEFEPKNNQQNLQLIDEIQQFLTKLRTALSPGDNLFLRSNKGFNICQHIKDIFNGVAKYGNNDLEDFFQALRGDIKTRYNSADFREIFHDKDVRGYIKKTFAELNKTSTFDKRAMLKFGAIAMNAEPEYLTQFNEFFDEKDKKKIEIYIDDINNYPTKGKALNDLVKEVLNFLIFDRYAKLDENNKSKVNNLINGFGKSSNNFNLRGYNNVNPKQKDFVLSNNMEIAVRAVSQKSNNQFNIQIEPILNARTPPIEAKIFEVKKAKRTGKTSTSTEPYKHANIFKDNTNANLKKRKIEKEHKIKFITPKLDEIDQIIEEDIKNLLGDDVNKHGDKTKAGIETTKEMDNKKTSVTGKDNKLKLIDAPIVNTDDESQEKTTKTSHKKNKQEYITKTAINNIDKSDSESEKSKENQETQLRNNSNTYLENENQEKQFRNNENTFLENNNDIIEITTESPLFFARSHSAEFSATRSVGNNKNIVSKADENDPKTSKESAKNLNNNQESKDKIKKDDRTNDDDNANLENELKSKENSEEKRNQEAFDKAEINFKILETEFNKIKNKKVDLAIIKPPPKKAFMKINRDLGI